MTDDVATLFPPPPHAEIHDDARAMAAVVRSWGRREIISSRLAYCERYAELFDARLAELHSELGLGALLLPESLDALDSTAARLAPGIATILRELSRADAALGTSLALEYALQAVVGQSPGVDDALRDLVAERAGGGVSLCLPGAGVLGEEATLFRRRALGALLDGQAGRRVLRGSSARSFGARSTKAGLTVVACANRKGWPCLAVIDADAKGIRRGTSIRTTGLEALEMAELRFDAVAVDERHILRGEGPLLALLTWLDVLLGAVSLGAAADFYDILSAWAEDRTIKGGEKLRENPLCAALLASVAGELVASTFLLYDLADMIARDGEAGGSTLERLFAFAQLLGARLQQGALLAIDRGLELMGSAGYAKEWHAEKHWRDVKTLKAILCGPGGEVPAQLDGARYFARYGEEG